MPDWRDWLTAFVLTQIVEVPILAAWLRGRPWPRRLGLAFGASAITHPILWFVLRPLLASHSFVAYVVIGESVATLLEAWYLQRLGVKDALLASVTSNAASWVTGRALLAIGWLPSLGCVLALATGLGLVGCSEPSGASVLADAIAPHEAQIERFAQWAERATRSAAPRQRARLDETLFATVRGDPRFVVIVVEREGHTPFRAAHPTDASVPDLAWQTVRTRHLGLLRAAADPTDSSRVWVRIAHSGDERLAITMELAPIEASSEDPAR